MEKLSSLDSFNALRHRLIDDRDPMAPTIVISAGTCGQASGANDLIRVTKRELLARGLAEKVHLRITGCHGFCESEPAVLVEPKGVFYPKVGTDDMVRIVEAVAAGKVLEDLLYIDETTGMPVDKLVDVPFFRRQVRTILSRNEKVDPIRIYDYIVNGGYAGLAKVLGLNDREWVVGEVKASGLRGRGGAGFPTGLKWELLAKQPGEKGKFLVCNADEGDPGAYMDRSVLEGNPHSIIEGMLIGAFGTGATEGVIYVRNEYPLAIKHLIIALRQARELGLLGERILGTRFSFDISMVRGAGAFVCGEETALIRSIEGKMGEPKQRPPFPVERGIDGKPTAINNVETWANIPVIVGQGAENFSKVGTKGNTGTKIFSLVGKIRNTGLVEVPMGITIDEIVNGIGGGSAGTARLKAVQTGGPSGGCIPASKFNLPIDYDSLAEAGSIMGSGGMIVMDANTCMVDVAKYFMKFLMGESCGKCFSCRKGTQRMYELLDDISKGEGTLEHLNLLEELAIAVRDTSMCGLGQSAANPVLSTLRYFRAEFVEHVYDKKCRAFVCKDLVGAPCQSACPLGTEAWRYVAHIARGEYQDAYQAIREANPFPSVCSRVCSHPCEARCRNAATGGEAVAIRTLKRFVTDTVDPSVYKSKTTKNGKSGKVAIVGSGPAGLTAAHYLSIAGHKVTVFESDDRLGGMLVSGIPAYRLPRGVMDKEIASLLNDNVETKCGVALGKDVTLDGLLKDGYDAAFLAMGAHKSRKLNLEGEDVPGVYPAIQFLKAFNLRGETLAKGRVGVIGGGDSAVDAAGVAIRQPGVQSATVFYRRTRDEMPALPWAVDAAIEEGVRLETLVAPVRILTENGKLTGIECIRCRLGEPDDSGRRRPEPIPGTEVQVPLDTLIVTIGDIPDIDYVSDMGLDVTEWGTLRVNPETLATSKKGVFAGGDVVTGPNTVVDAIAAGKKAAIMIGRYLNGEDLKQPTQRRLPDKLVEPPESPPEQSDSRRAKTPMVSPKERAKTFGEVELSLTEAEARREALRCLRCDLDFTRKAEAEEATTGGKR